MNIAIVDDRKTDSDRLVGLVDTYAEQHQLQWGQWTVFTAGRVFLGAFTAGTYDLIFLDIYMDGITGMETAKRIRRAIMAAGSSLSPPPLNLPWRATT